MNKFYLFAAAAAIALCSCSSNDNEDPQGGLCPDINTNAPRFSATIGTQTRAYDQTWEAGDAIGISVTTGGKAYDNVSYTTTGDGNFTVTTAGQEIYFQDNNTATFTAYYPFAADAANIGAGTLEQKNQKQFDYLWAQAQGSKANNNVAFNFAHKMSKVVLTVKKGADVSFDEVKNAVLMLEGFKHEGTFNATTGTATATGNAVVMWEFANNTGTTDYNAPFTTDNDNETVTYTLIFFPQEFTAPLPFTATITGMQSFAAGLDFTAANSEKDNNAKNEWVAGRQYNISVTLNKTSLIVNGCTIKAWEEVDGGNTDAK